MRHTEKKKQLWITTFGLLVFLHLCVFTAYRISKNADSWSDIIPEAKFEPTQMKTPVGQRGQRSSSSSQSSPARVIYPYSIIRGGVRNAEEFKAALLKDKVVAAHFSSFSAPSSRIVELKAEKAAYVAYRVNDKVYWTKKKVRLVKGEKLITDGVNYARARCGNRISEVSQIPMSPEEPSHAFLDRPIPTEDKDPLLLAAMPNPAGALPEHTPPSAFGFASRSKIPFPRLPYSWNHWGRCCCGTSFRSRRGFKGHSCSAHRWLITEPIANSGRSRTEHTALLGIRIGIRDRTPKTIQELRAHVPGGDCTVGVDKPRLEQACLFRKSPASRLAIPWTREPLSWPW